MAGFPSGTSTLRWIWHWAGSEGIREAAPNVIEPERDRRGHFAASKPVVESSASFFATKSSPRGPLSPFASHASDRRNRFL